MTDLRAGDAVNQSVADHVAETREQLERGRLEIERQRQALLDLAHEHDDAAA